MENIDTLTNQIFRLKRKINKRTDTIGLQAELNKVNQLIQQLAELKHAQRSIPAFKTQGVTVFHVLTPKDMRKIRELTGTNKQLVRVNNMVTAKFSFKNKSITIYLDIFPAFITYDTKLV